MFDHISVGGSSAGCVPALEPGSGTLRRELGRAQACARVGLGAATTIGREIAANPFPGWDSGTLRAGLGMDGAGDLVVFTQTRRRRGVF